MFLIGAEEVKRLFAPLRNTANRPGTTTTPLPHRSMPLMPSLSSSCNCGSLRNGMTSIGRYPFGRVVDLSKLSPSRNAMGVEMALHSMANLAVVFRQDASTQVSRTFG